MVYTYKTTGVCSRSITIEVEGDTVKSAVFEGGCNGNTKGISGLVAGMKIDDIISRLEVNGINADRKTIYSDLDALEQYGMRITTSLPMTRRIRRSSISV